MKQSINRALGTIGIIYQIGKRAVTGEPFYLMLVLPRRERVFSELKDTSIPIIDSAFHANLAYLEENDYAPVRLTDDEQAFINEKKN